MYFLGTTVLILISSAKGIAAANAAEGPKKEIGKLPALGWNSWNAFRGDINEAKILDAANSLVSLGLKNLGYEYVNIDDCWSIITGRTNNRIVPDPVKFPSGISGVATAVHKLGLKLGIYSDAGTKTCAGYPGSLEYEEIDAKTFAEWGVDYLKYDNCNVPSNWSDAGNYDDWKQSKSYQRYKRMGDALNTVTRPIQYGLCNWGNAQVWTWGAQVGHSWRMTGDSNPTWSFIQSAIINNAKYLDFVDFWAHNDMDMMEIGNGALTIAETRTHMAAWAFMKSPIILGTVLKDLTPPEISIIQNRELLAFSQDDTIGAPAKPYKPSSSSSPPEYFAGKSKKGIHVFVINFSGEEAMKNVTFSEVPGLEAAAGGDYVVHDCWSGKDVGKFRGSYGVKVGAHDTLAVLIVPA